VLVSVAASPPTATVLAAALSTPREGHTTTFAGNDLLVCGGADASGRPIASCDLLDGTTFGIKQTVPLGAARRDHRADRLETGPVLIAGGSGADGQPMASMEIYTP
jgi:hypothetical protein